MMEMKNVISDNLLLGSIKKSDLHSWAFIFLLCYLVLWLWFVFAGKWAYQKKEGLAIPVLFSLEVVLLVCTRVHMEQP